MKFLSAFALTALLSTNVYATLTEKDYVATYVKAMNTAETTVWPGYSLEKAPILLHFFNTHHSYIFNFQPTNPRWSPIKVENRLGYSMDVSKGDIYEIEKYYDPEKYPAILSTKRIDGQSTPLYIANLNNPEIEDPKTLTAYTLLYQTEKFGFSDVPDEAYTDYNGFNQLMNVKLVYLEEEVLKHYVEGEQSENDLQTAVAVHQYRQKMLNADSLNWENVRDTQDGYTFYISLKSVFNNPSEYLEAVKKYIYPYRCPYESKGGYESKMGCFYYEVGKFTGSIYSSALDTKLDPLAWKAKALKENISSISLLQDYYKMSDSLIEKLVKAAMESPLYHYDEIEKQADLSFKPTIDELNQIVEQYNNQKGYELIITATGLPGDIRGKNYVESFSLLKDYMICLGPLRHYDYNKHILITFNKGTIVHDIDHFNFYPWKNEIKFKLPAETEIELDGKKVTLEDLFKNQTNTTVHQLKIETSAANVTVDKEEVLIDATTGVLKVDIKNKWDERIGDNKVFRRAVMKKGFVHPVH